MQFNYLGIKPTKSRHLQCYQKNSREKHQCLWFPGFNLEPFQSKRRKHLTDLFPISNDKKPSQHVRDVGDRFYLSLLRNGLDNWPKA